MLLKDSKKKTCVEDILGLSIEPDDSDKDGTVD